MNNQCRKKLRCLFTLDVFTSHVYIEVSKRKSNINPHTIRYTMVLTSLEGRVMKTKILSRTSVEAKVRINSNTVAILNIIV